MVDALQESDRTCEFVKSKISMCEIKGQSDLNTKKASAFKTEKKMTCFECGKPGYMKKDCWYKQNASGYSGAEGGASRHGGARQQTQFRGRGGSGGRSFGRGRGRGRQQPTGGSVHHIYNDGDDTHGTNDDSWNGCFLTQVERSDERTNKVVAYSCENYQIDWILDSGCSDHIINDENLFSESKSLKNLINVKVGDGRILKGTKIGNVVTYFMVNGVRKKIKINNVYYVKNMDKNLISFAKVTDENKVESIGNFSKIYNRTNELIGVAYKEYGLYKMISFLERKEASVGNTEKMTEKEKFHRMLGHVSFQYLDTMSRDKLVDGSPENFEPVYLKCGTSIQNKMRNLPFRNDRSRASEILELVHTDLNGPHNTTGFDGSKYFLTFIDDYSKCAVVYTIKS